MSWRRTAVSATDGSIGRLYSPADPPRALTAGQLLTVAQEMAVANRFHFDTFAEYLFDRRARGWGYGRIARESGLTLDRVRSARRRLEPVLCREAAV